jgi:hypothetical protein
MLLIIFLGLIAKLTFVSGECDIGTPNMDDFVWTKVSVTILTGIVKEAAVETLFFFPLTISRYRISD